MDDGIAWGPMVTFGLCPQGKPKFPKGRLDLPETDGQPGVYRIDLPDGFTHGGQSKNLAKRFDDYRNPKAGVETEAVLHGLLVEARTARVQVASGPAYASAAARHAAERKAIQAAASSGAHVLNKAGSGSNPHAAARWLRGRAAYHRRELARIEAEIAQLPIPAATAGAPAPGA